MCHNTLLGLRGCAGESQPITGLYIDDLGINNTLLGQLITDQYETGLQLFEDKRAFAWRKISSDILTRLAPSLKADTVIEGKRIGQMTTNASNTQPALSAGTYGGIRVKVDPNNSSFLKLFVAEMSIATSGSDIDVLVFDMNTLKLIDTITIASGGADQYIGIDLAAKRRKMDLAFVWEQDVAVPKMNPKRGDCYGCGGGIKYSHICPFVDAQGITLTTDGTAVLTNASQQYTSGLSMTYNVNCDREAWICSIGGLLAMSLAYATAVEIYDYALNASPTMRVNTAVTLNKEAFIQARDTAAQRYNDELTAVLQNMRMPNDVHCFDCRRNMKYVTALP